MKMSKKEAEKRRKARNLYSLLWKQENAKKVQKWNRAWYLRKCEEARKAA